MCALEMHLLIYLQYSSDTLLMTDVTTFLKQSDRNLLISSLCESSTDGKLAFAVRPLSHGVTVSSTFIFTR